MHLLFYGREQTKILEGAHGVEHLLQEQSVKVCYDSACLSFQQTMSFIIICSQTE
jgi:hypothetical protein